MNQMAADEDDDVVKKNNRSGMENHQFGEFISMDVIEIPIT